MPVFVQGPSNKNPRPLTRWLLPALILLFLVSTPVVSFENEGPFLEAAEKARNRQHSFALLIEQDRAVYSPDNGETIHLKRSPFTLWVLYTGGVPQVLINVSAKDLLFAPVSQNDDLEESLGEDYMMLMGLAEGLYNSDNLLFLDLFGCHYLPDPSAGEHRFDRALWGDGYVAGGREVEKVIDLTGESSAEYPLTRLPYKTLYITGLHTEYDANYNKIVRESTAFKIELLP